MNPRTPAQLAAVNAVTAALRDHQALADGIIDQGAGHPDPVTARADLAASAATVAAAIATHTTPGVGVTAISVEVAIITELAVAALEGQQLGAIPGAGLDSRQVAAAALGRAIALASSEICGRI